MNMNMKMNMRQYTYTGAEPQNITTSEHQNLRIKNYRLKFYYRKCGNTERGKNVRAMMRLFREDTGTNDHGRSEHLTKWGKHKVNKTKQQR